MIKTETITIRDRQMARTYSDAGMMIERDGVRYSEAVDPIGSGRTYTETDEPIPEEPMDWGRYWRTRPPTAPWRALSGRG